MLSDTDIQLQSQGKPKRYLLEGGRDSIKQVLQMKPDLLFIKGEQKIIMDTKWKQLDKKHMASPADLYQIYAYLSLIA